MSETLATRQHHWPGRTLAWHWTGEAPWDDAVVRTLAVLEDVLRPCSLEMLLACAEPGSGMIPDEATRDTGPASVLLRLCRDDSGVHVDPCYAPCVVEVLQDAVAVGGVAAWLAAAPARHRRCAAGLEPAWEQLRIDAVRVWVGTESTLAVAVCTEAGQTVAVPMPHDAHDAQGAWVQGPMTASRDALRAPAVCAFAREGPGLRLDLTLHWTCFTDPDQPAAQRLRAAAERLAALGWDAELDLV